MWLTSFFSAGTGGDSNPIATPDPIQTSDRAGAGIITGLSSNDLLSRDTMLTSSSADSSGSHRRSMVSRLAAIQRSLD